MATNTNTDVMNVPPVSALKRGDGIRIRFGSRNSQLAMVHDVTRAGNVRVFKWSARGKVWKGPLRLGANDLISRARNYEFAQLAPMPPEYCAGAAK